MQTIDDLFAAFGGPANFGRVIGKRTEHAGSMKARGYVPVLYWALLVKSERGQEIGLTFESLHRLHFGEMSPEPGVEAQDGT